MAKDKVDEVNSRRVQEVKIVGFDVSIWDITKFMLKCIPASILYSVIVFGLLFLLAGVLLPLLAKIDFNELIKHFVE
ncbi:MAG: hypothetical protein JXR97_06885 [Planctomycetes bacterium]|nr:hypothetical protein [Planctomycetota bacterium]